MLSPTGLIRTIKIPTSLSHELYGVLRKKLILTNPGHREFRDTHKVLTVAWVITFGGIFITTFFLVIIPTIGNSEVPVLNQVYYTLLA